MTANNNQFCKNLRGNSVRRVSFVAAFFESDFAHFLSIGSRNGSRTAWTMTGLKNQLKKLAVHIVPDLPLRKCFERWHWSAVIAIAVIACFPSTSQAAVLDGRQWGNGGAVTITYSFSNLLDGNLGGGLPNNEIRLAVEEALNLWAANAPLTFIEVPDSGPLPNSADNPYLAPGHPQIRFGHFAIDGPFNTLAHAHVPPPNNGGRAGDVHYDTDENHTIDGVGGIDFIQLSVHEIGHSLGLLHEPSAPAGNDAIMNQGKNRAQGYAGLGTALLFPDDIAGIQSIYGAGDGTVTSQDATFGRVWNDASDGDFSNPERWSGHVPDGDNQAVFNREGEYDVHFTSDATTQAASVDRGDITLNMNGRTWTVNDDFLMESGATANLVGGNLNLNSGGTLNIGGSGNITLGTGTLTITDNDEIGGFNGVISGAGGLTMQGSANLVTTDFTSPAAVVSQSGLHTIHGQAVVSADPSGGQNDIHASILVNGQIVKTSNQISLSDGFEGTVPYSYTGNFSVGDTIEIQYTSQQGIDFEFKRGDLNLVGYETISGTAAATHQRTTIPSPGQVIGGGTFSYRPAGSQITIEQSGLHTIHGEAVVSANPSGEQNDLHATILVNSQPVKTSNQFSLSVGSEGTLSYTYTGQLSANDIVEIDFDSQQRVDWEFFNGDINVIGYNTIAGVEAATALRGIIPSPGQVIGGGTFSYRPAGSQITIEQSGLHTIHGEAVVSANPSGGQNDIHARILVNSQRVKRSNEISLSDGFEGTLPYSYTGNFSAGDIVEIDFFSQLRRDWEFFNGDINVVRYNAINGTSAANAFRMDFEDHGKVILNGNNTYTGPTNVDQGILEVNGSIGAQGAAGPLSVAANAVLTGTGLINVTSVANFGTIDLDAGAQMVVGGTLNIFGTGAVAVRNGSQVVAPLTQLQGTLELNNGSLFGTLDLTGGGLFLNNGTHVGQLIGGSRITATHGTSSIGDEQSASGFNFAGDLVVHGGATLQLGDIDTAQLGSTTTLTNGALLAHNGLSIDGSDTISGYGIIVGSVGGTNAGAGLQIASSPTGSVDLSGDLDIRSSTANVYSQGEAGLGTYTTLEGGSLNALNGLRLDPGETLAGTGDIVTSLLTNNGLISPGHSPGILTIDGDYIQGPDGELILEIGGPIPGVDHDVIEITGDAIFDGMIVIDFLPGFETLPGESFDIIQVDGLITELFSLELHHISSDFQFDANFLNGTFTMTSLSEGRFVSGVPEPSAFILATLSLLSLGMTRRRRRR